MKDRQSSFLVLAWATASLLALPAAYASQTSVAEPELLEAPRPIEKLEDRIQRVHQKVAPALVSLVEGRGENLEGVASGVLVSADGLVLTAGHCFNQPGDRVRIQLPDGRVLKAVTLGKQRELDFGLIQIKNVEGLPFCELGEVEALCRDDVCLMYGHPDGIKKDRPAVVRLGTFLGLREDGMLRTSCLMMPGDSGGPLFDLDGKVVGINSEIDEALDDNFHASALAVRENWDRLLESEAWGTDPDEARGQEYGYGYGGEMEEPEVDEPREPNADSDRGRLLPGGLKGLRGAFQFGDEVSGAVCRLRSVRGEELLSALGTVVSSDGLLVSKSSRVGDFDVRCDLPGRGPLNAEVVARDRALDLVLLRVPLRDLPAVDVFTPSPKLSPGRLVATLGREGDPLHAGVYGVAPRKIERVRTGYLGIYFGSQEGGPPLIREAPEAQPAFTAGLRADDVIVGFDESEIESEDALRKYLRGTGPGQKVRVRVLRAGEERTFDVVLGDREDFNGGMNPGMMHPAYLTETSERRGGFERAFRHDMPLELHEVGGPVIDLSGRVVGINIARVDRPGSLALPLEEVAAFVARRQK